MSRKRPLKDRFYVKVRYNPSVIRTYERKDGTTLTVIYGCFEWTAATTNGYGRIQAGGKGSKVLKAHRVRYELETGLEIPDGLCVCHRCDNRLCVTSAHFFLGNKGDNNRDKVKKGRQSKGEKHPNTHVPDDVIAWVISAYAAGEFSQRELAEHVGVAQQTVSSWVRGRWRAS